MHEAAVEVTWVNQRHCIILRFANKKPLRAKVHYATRRNFQTKLSQRRCEACHPLSHDFIRLRGDQVNETLLVAWRNDLSVWTSSFHNVAPLLAAACRYDYRLRFLQRLHRVNNNVLLQNIIVLKRG